MTRDLPPDLIFSIAQRGGVEFLRGSTAEKKIVRCVDAASHRNGDKRPSAWLHGPTNSYGCAGCGARMSAKDFAAAVGVEWSTFLTEELARPAPRAAPRKPSHKPTIAPSELSAFWAATLPVNRTIVDPHVLDMGVCFYLARRGWYAPALATLDLVRVTPLPDACDWPSWWPAAWASTWRLVMRAYDAHGDVASVHARSIVPDAEPKTRWPRGVPAGYLFADKRGVALLRGEPGDTDRVVICEGMTDTVAMALAVADAGRRFATIGITAGATKTLREVRWPKVPIVVATDHDDAGERYAREIFTALSTHPDVRRTRSPIAEAAIR